MFERNSIQYLRQWRTKTNRKPLILRGARQVGKTTIVSQFAKDFNQYVYLNLEKEQDCRLFSETMDIEQTIERISYSTHTQLDSETLLFIDEIQNSPLAIQQLRYFYENHPEICVIAAGSLLENYAGKTFSFPVGRVEYMAMHPCNFYEFLNAIGKTDDQKTILENKGHLIHERLMQSFKTYTLIGGMPEIVANYAETQNIRASESIYSTLLNAYKDDVEKYAISKSQAATIRHILEYGWAKAGEIITYEKFAGSNYKSREISEAFLTLQKSMLLETTYPTSCVQMPIIPNLSHHPKLLCVDTGLVTYQSGIRDELFNSTDIQDVYRGKIAEHIVGQELIAYSNSIDSKRYFWQKSVKSEAEVDFLYVFESKLIPIEVKSGANAKLKSIQQFMALSPTKIAIRIWSKPFEINDIANPIDGKTFKLINMPFYMVGMLDKIIQENI
ncbi:MAG: ATP-binding protein [Paludibacteraceae bacterium]|nr:ATP-binding protein [Paludibacteraceae bacterium]